MRIIEHLEHSWTAPYEYVKEHWALLASLYNWQVSYLPLETTNRSNKLQCSSSFRFSSNSTALLGNSGPIVEIPTTNYAKSFATPFQKRYTSQGAVDTSSRAAAMQLKVGVIEGSARYHWVACMDLNRAYKYSTVKNIQDPISRNQTV